MAQTTYMEAIRDGMRQEMKKNPKVYLAGEDVAQFGGCFGVSAGLYDEFGPKRVRNTPISEAAIVGHGVGAAASGLRPIVEIMFVDFMGCCMDELFNNAAKLRFMTGGKCKIPMVIRTPCGAGFGGAAQHSQCVESWFTHIPGIKTVMPSTPADAKGLMMAAVEDDSPVVYIEHKGLLGLAGDAPEGDTGLIQLGKADIKLAGSDVTIVAWSAMLHKALAAAATLATKGIKAEVIDPRTLIPFDKDAVLKSVAKTGKLVIVHEEVKTSGFGGEIAAMIADEGFDYLDAPIKRVAGLDTPIPFSPGLEQAFIPSEEKIIAAVESMF